MSIPADWDATAALASAVGLGLLGSTHCIGMCGGIAGLLGTSLGAHALPHRGALLLAYNLGRLLSYSAAGALVGALARPLGEFPAGGLLLRVLAGLLLVAMGAQLSGLSTRLAQLERLGAGLWRLLQPLARRSLSVREPRGALVAGMVWGWLPCGLVYTTLAWAATAGTAGRSSLLMAAFGLGTLPAMLATGFFASALVPLLQWRGLRSTLGALVAGYGIWIILGTIGHLGHGGPHH